MKLRRILPCLLALLLALGLTGCGYPELYERVLIHGIGVDWTGENYKVTVRSSASAEDEGEELFTCEGATVLEALSGLSLSTGREPFYAHNYLVVFGQACANRGLEDCLDFFVRYYNTRPTVSLFMALGTAEEVLSTEKDGKLMRMSELQALGAGGSYNGQVVDVDILDFVNALKGESGSPVLPVLRAVEGGVEATGSAYFAQSRPAGLLTLEQTRSYLAVMDRLERGELAVDVPGAGPVTLSLRGAKSSVETVFGQVPAFTLRVTVDADVSAVDGTPPADGAFYPALEQAAAARLEEELRATLQQTLADGCDIFGFGSLLYRRWPVYWRQHSAQWPELMGQAQYTVQYTVKVRHLEQENLNGLLSP